MASAALSSFTVTEYLALEKASDRRHELVDGAIVAMAGARPAHNANPPSLLNPMAVVEVTSDTNEDFDRGKKFLHYQSIEELRHYVILSHRERRIDHFRREGDDQWHLTTHTRDEDLVELLELGGSIALADVYGGVDLDEGRAART